MKTQTSPLLTLALALVAGAIILLVVCGVVLVGVNQFVRSASPTSPTTAALGSTPIIQTVVVPETVVVPATSALPDVQTVVVPQTVVVAPTTASPVNTDTPIAPGAPTPTQGVMSALKVSTASGQGTGLRVNIRYADGSPASGKYVHIYNQKQDVSGNPVTGDRIADGSTDNSGTVLFTVNPGTIAIQMDLPGYPFGNQFNYVVSNDLLTVLDVSLGRFSIGVKNADGQPLSDRYTTIYLQKADISGNPAQGDRVAGGGTDNTGVINFDLTAGTYWVDVGNIQGYLWGDPFNRQVTGGQTTSIIVSLGRLSVGVKDADGKGQQNKYVTVYMQKKDVNGNPIFGDRVAAGNTDNTGIINFDLTAGTYGVEIDGLAGGPWGNPFTHVAASATDTIVVGLGRLTIGLKDASGNPIGNRYVTVYAQKKDVSGNITEGDRLAAGYTDNTGLLNLDLTAGNYAVDIDQIGPQLNVPIQSGHVTFTDGHNSNVR